MASDKDVKYHRTFLSPNYWDNIYPLTPVTRAEKHAGEVTAIRERDPAAFEEARKALAQAMGVKYWPGAVPSFGAKGPAPRYVQGNPPDATVAATMDPTNPPQGVVQSPDTGKLAIPVHSLRLKAYVLGEKNGLHATVMAVKTDQLFNHYATPWESRWSSLVAPSNYWGFTPIVDSSWQVIGHMGKVYDGNGMNGDPAELIIPDCFDQDDFTDAVNNGIRKIPVFVASRNHFPNGWYAPDPGSERTIVVITNHNGVVLDMQVKGGGYLEQVWYSPLDILAVGKIVITLGKFGMRRYAQSLLRREMAEWEARATFNGATKQLAREAEAKAAKDTAARAIQESGLVPLLRARGTASRVLTPAEMETFIRDVLRQRPYLSRLRSVTSNEELLAVIKEWERHTGKRFLKVTKGTPTRLKSEGVGGWARDPATGKEVMIIEGEVFRSEVKATEEVVHELANEAVREGKNLAMPKLNIPASMNNAMQWLEAWIQHGDEAFAALRSLGRR